MLGSCRYDNSVAIFYSMLFLIHDKCAFPGFYSKKLIDDIAKQMEKFCKAKSVSTVQVVGFKGSIGTQSEADVKRQWLDTLKEHGIGMREVDSTRLSGCLMTQVSGDDSLVLLTCTLTDNRGAEICTFRVRKVIPTKSINQASPVVAQVTQ